MPLTVIRNDITKMNVDAVVDAAVVDAADTSLKAGSAVIKRGFNLPAKYIIHTAGPVYHGGKFNEEALLRSCYKNSLDIAKKRRCKSIAFPLISSGIYDYPKDEALSAATSAISEWLAANDMDVSLVVFDKAAFAVSQELLGGVKAFIDENYVDEKKLRYSLGRTQSLGKVGFYEIDTSARPTAPFISESKPAWPIPPARKSESYDMKWTLDEPFSSTLLRLIDVKGKTDVEIYKRANLDRKLFSKIRTGKGYMPSKKTVAALAVALELSLAETRDLMGRAGFALSRSVMFDVIIEYFITQKDYDIFKINNVLFEYDQPLLGG